LIFEVSLVDEMLDRIGCTLQNQTEIENNASIPSKVGTGFSQEKISEVREYVKSFGVAPDHNDMQGWDTSVQGWEFDLEAEHRALLAGVTPDSPFAIYLSNIFYLRSYKVLILSDGTVLEQTERFYQPSGAYCTSSSNSRMRVSSHVMIGGKSCAAQGDDAVTDPVENSIEKYATLGHVCKANPAVEGFEFCSHLYRNDGITYSLNAAKMTYSLLGKGGTVEEKQALYEDWLSEMIAVPDAGRWKEIVEDSGWRKGIAQHSLGFKEEVDQNGFRAKQNAERLHGSLAPVRSLRCIVPESLQVSNTMARTRKQKQQSTTKLVKKVAALQLAPKKKKTPFADVGSVVGKRVGDMFGFKSAGNIGRWLGTGIGSIFGSGDYTMSGQPSSYNVFTNDRQIPKFSTTSATNIVCHREYLGDIQGTAGFNNTSYPLNPGMETTFPWLSSIAANYQQYKFHGLIFEFRPLITDFVTGGAPGVVIMSTNYNSDLPKYTTKQQMENAEYAVSVKPTREVIHGVECATQQTPISELYVRTGAVTTGQDLRTYDLGNFQFATQSNPVQNLGELWVSYCVEFFKPTLPSDVSGAGIDSYHLQRGNPAAGSALGTTTTISVGNLNQVVFNNNAINWYANPGTQWYVTFTWSGVAAVFTPASFTPLNGTIDVIANTSLNPSVAPPSLNTTVGTITFTYNYTGLNPGFGGVNFAGGGSYPGAGYVDCYVTQLSSSVTA